jgi:hypothetical protein
MTVNAGDASAHERTYRRSHVRINREGAEMNFLVRPGTPLHRAQLRARALSTWRDAEQVVRLRWETFLGAEGASRRHAFAAYVAALDAEAAAASELAGVCSDLAQAA